MIAESDIPASFMAVPYDAARIPELGATLDLSDGANCQLFAYTLLRHFGGTIPPFRSSDLWADTGHTVAISDNLDLLLFNATPNAWGAHVALSLGGDRAIHLSQRVGRPAIWTLAEFATEDDYRVLIGGKRLRHLSTKK